MTYSARFTEHILVHGARLRSTTATGTRLASCLLHSSRRYACYPALQPQRHKLTRRQIAPSRDVYAQKGFVGTTASTMSVQRGEQLRLYDTIDSAWSLVQRTAERGGIGYVPSDIIVRCANRSFTALV